MEQDMIDKLWDIIVREWNPDIKVEEWNRFFETLDKRNL